ncbi:DUF2617 family protein [Candidatus Mycobacterium wuenschmannii]|uniref:DUF2617 family protein n=1 Tax=Candidatus Mycobacterium wuenschmannii TaxID=3027808 RepID=A0ABY8W0L3_9MYCO|nr:DUF2617 family protein [Candidatus Mycobacterium wuenschmannii]WIM88512.1 DUF2617 family protein [Candidatus Mycobacterium wuenschmannii]
MPLHRLSVTPVDVRGSELGLALNLPVPLPLAIYRVDHPNGGALMLGVLGASHVVTVEHPNTTFSEQISCDLAGALPEQTHAPGYQLESRTDLLGEAEFRRLAEWLRERCGNETGWLGGTFPGDDAALTALAAEPAGAGWRWQTWHLYPAEAGGTVVYTSSRWRP